MNLTPRYAEDTTLLRLEIQLEALPRANGIVE